jgi:hypothetical protein
VNGLSDSNHLRELKWLTGHVMLGNALAGGILAGRNISAAFAVKC